MTAFDGDPSATADPGDTPAFEAIQALPSLCSLIKRSPTLDGQLPLRAAQHCSPVFEGNEAGFQIVLAQPMALRRNRRGLKIDMTPPAFEQTQQQVGGAIDRLVEGGLLERGGYWHRLLAEDALPMPAQPDPLLDGVPGEACARRRAARRPRVQPQQPYLRRRACDRQSLRLHAAGARDRRELPGGRAGVHRRGNRLRAPGREPGQPAAEIDPRRAAGGAGVRVVLRRPLLRDQGEEADREVPPHASRAARCHRRLPATARSSTPARPRMPSPRCACSTTHAVSPTKPPLVCPCRTAP